jgi:hypothetical protein
MTLAELRLWIFQKFQRLLDWESASIGDLPVTLLGFLPEFVPLHIIDIIGRPNKEF